VVLATSGPAALAGSRVLDLTSGVLFIVLSGVGAAGTTMMAHRIGAGDLAAARAAVRTVAGVAVAFAAVATAVLPWVVPDLLEAVAGGQVRAVAAPWAWPAVLQVWWMAAVVTTNAVLRSFGDTRTTMRASLTGEYLVFLPVGLVTCRVAGWGLGGVFLAHHLFWATFLTVGLLAARRHLRRGTPVGAPADRPRSAAGPAAPPVTTTAGTEDRDPR
jgi:Na+-driven multidrug efflux pump